MSKDIAPFNADDQQLANQTLATSVAIGFEGVPSSIIPLPRIRIVQPVSRDVALAGGGEAPAGTFFINDLQEARPELHIAIIAAEVKPATFDDPRTGQPITKDRLNMIFYDLDDQRVALMGLSATSFGAFGQMIAQSRKQGWQHAWDKYLTVTTTKLETETAKYYVANFAIGEGLSPADQQTLAAAWMEFGSYLTRSEAGEDA